ncbi:hypothetical protein [Pectobacterium carotovorum]|uniref:hypothetical protein n=1 Tax=Pectobacterium carotovorum TaxID=554 RepID=UPI0015DFE5E5|nr:hypothetical protein [Pectobacterium carotovorum]MBA0192078.1 hypothetical protein [Pectobacterium carotovorum]MBA0200557.1 hypothetical protein [Pectobacterium carotovorum]
MVRLLRISIILVSIIYLGYAIYKYIENPSTIYYITGGASALLAAITSYIEMNKKNATRSITTGNNSTIIDINGRKNTINVKNEHGVK